MNGAGAPTVPTMATDDPPMDPGDRPWPRRSPVFDDERQYREHYSETTVRGVTVGTIADRFNDDAWIRSTLVVDNEP